uniref:Uncharacterized protein n=1 Tax=Oryza rufipogon TaxID=4529 RepID=A0A0E0PE73_ORYRU
MEDGKSRGLFQRRGAAAAAIVSYGSKGWRSGLESRGEYSYGANLHAGPHRLRNVRCVSYFWGCIMLLRVRPDGLYSPSKSSPWNYPIIHTF